MLLHHYYTIFSDFGVLNVYRFFILYDFFLYIFHACYVIVYVHCHITMGVPHDVLYDLNIHAMLRHVRAGGMPQAMA